MWILTETGGIPDCYWLRVEPYGSIDLQRDRKYDVRIRVEVPEAHDSSPVLEPFSLTPMIWVGGSIPFSA